MKRASVRISDVAVTDILEQADWYHQHSGFALANRWESAVTSALIRILANPNSGQLCRFNAVEIKDVRRATVARFPKHLIFYRAEGDDVLILRVVHGARDLESLF